ncbi:MAG: pilus assembly protein PilC [Deltaproteobacteria bacterium DG_8]|nr:MAG: pilus assembly protein PilC [Deltaproteobacteria bacterium DG_8]
MPVYVWEGKTARGNIQKGEMEAINQAAVRSVLRGQRIQVTKVKAKPKDLLENISFLQPKVKGKNLVVFTRQFSTMIDAGLPLIQGLDILGSQEPNPTLKKAISRIKGDVESGSTLSNAIKKHTKIFSDLYVSLVAAGEIGGTLDTILNRLAVYIEKAEKLKSKVKGALVYPTVVLIISIIVIAILLIFVIPVFQEMFEGLGGELPALTQFVVDLSQFLRNNIIYIIAILVALYFAFVKFKSTEKGRVLVDKTLLGLPIFGNLLKKSAIANFSRTLATMTTSGVPILDGLGIVASTAGNKVIEKSILDTKVSISEGKTIAEPLGKSGIFPPMVTQMISVGESTGALDTMLEKIADFYEDEVDAAVDALTSLIEPFMMVFLGGTIGTMLAAMYLPIFKMAGALGGG